MPDTLDIERRRLFEDLAREHGRMLMAFLRAAVRDAVAAEDLFQEVMLVLWRRLDDYDRSRPAGPWLRGIAMRQVLAHRRRQARGPIVADEAVLAALDASVGQVADGRDDWAEEVRRCVQRLSPRLGEVVRLHYWHGLGVEQIATQLAIGVEAGKKRLQRGRAEVTRCLRRRGILSEISHVSQTGPLTQP